MRASHFLFLAGAVLVLASPGAAHAQSKQEFIDALAPKTRGLSLQFGEDKKAEPAAAVAAPATQPMTPPAPPPSIAFQVRFAFGSDELTPDAKAKLNELGQALLSEQLTPFRFQIAGHTDSVGSEAANQGLSQRRAQAVTDYLVATFGVDRARLQSVGYGESKLLDAANPTSGINRRVEVTNVGRAGG